ncbi:MAG TPA: HK97-gp10 family putative phage morphogenesis protein [Burkholderiaceae bacterium]|nr:HK97-gp10 family putative phage morphogenesis protein [Burkholderiaceae bacterium]
MTGLRELGAALKELDSRVQKRIARSATAAGARVIANEAKSRVPVDKGTVKKNIRTANLKPTQPGLQETAVGVRVKGKTEVSAFHWRFLEFGTAKMPAKPFLRPAFEAKKEEAANRIKEQLAKRLDAEAAKIGATIGKAK